MIESVRIMGRDYRVRACPNLIVDDAHDADAVTRTLRMRIDPCLHPVQQGQGILHELSEIVQREMRIPLSHDDLTRYTEVLFAVLRDNPEVARHIVAGRRIVPKP